MFPRSLEGRVTPLHSESRSLIHVHNRYRRGKAESNDVDIVFTHPEPEKVKGLCKRFVKHLYDKGNLL